MYELIPVWPASLFNQLDMKQNYVHIVYYCFCGTGYVTGLCSIRKRKLNIFILYHRNCSFERHDFYEERLFKLAARTWVKYICIFSLRKYNG